MNNLFTEIQKMVKQQHRNHARQTKPNLILERVDETTDVGIASRRNGKLPDDKFRDKTAENYSNIHEDDPQEDANYVERNKWTGEEL